MTNFISVCSGTHAWLRSKYTKSIIIIIIIIQKIQQQKKNANLWQLAIATPTDIIITRNLLISQTNLVVNLLISQTNLVVNLLISQTNLVVNLLIFSTIMPYTILSTIRYKVIPTTVEANEIRNNHFGPHLRFLCVMSMVLNHSVSLDREICFCSHRGVKGL